VYSPISAIPDSDYWLVTDSYLNLFDNTTRSAHRPKWARFDRLMSMPIVLMVTGIF